MLFSSIQRVRSNVLLLILLSILAAAATSVPALAQAQEPTWSVTQYRQGEKSSAGQAEEILTKPVADTYLRVGPFASREEAERLRYMLAGPDASTIEASGSRSDPAYRVRLGPYDDTDAATAMARISTAGFAPEASAETGLEAGGYKR